MQYLSSAGPMPSVTCCLAKPSVPERHTRHVPLPQKLLLLVLSVTQHKQQAALGSQQAQRETKQGWSGRASTSGKQTPSFIGMRSLATAWFGSSKIYASIKEALSSPGQLLATIILMILSFFWPLFPFLWETDFMTHCTKYLVTSFISQPTNLRCSAGINKLPPMSPHATHQTKTLLLLHPKHICTHTHAYAEQQDMLLLAVGCSNEVLQIPSEDHQSSRSGRSQVTPYMFDVSQISPG